MLCFCDTRHVIISIILTLIFTPTLPRFTEVLVSNQESEGVYLCIRVIDFTSFYNFSIGFWNCFDSVVFVVFHWYCVTIANTHTLLHTAFFKIKISSDLCPEISVIGHQNVRN
jgi:hypothetical protein